MGWALLGPVVPAGPRGRRCGLEGTGKHWGTGGWGPIFSFLPLQAVIPVKEAKPGRGKEVGWRQGPFPVSLGPVCRTDTSVTRPSGPGVGLGAPPTPVVTVVQGGRGPGD